MPLNLSEVKILFGDIEIGADKLLAIVRKGEQVAPQAAAALGVLLKAADNAIVASQSAAQQTGLNIALDQTAWAAIAPLWPDVKVLAADLGIKI